MPLALIDTYIENIAFDVVAIAVDESLKKGDRAFHAIIFRKGDKLKKQLIKQGLSETGIAKEINPKNLVDNYCSEKSQKVVVAVAPRWIDGQSGECDLLANCYTSILNTASKYGRINVGISLIASNEYGIPQDVALEVALQTISMHPNIDRLNVFLVMGNKCISTRNPLACAITSYNVFDESSEIKKEVTQSFAAAGGVFALRQQFHPVTIRIGHDEIIIPEPHGESFSQMLLRKIDESGMKDSEVYKKAQVSKQLFSKIRSNHEYQPKKGTAIAFAMALKLNMNDTEQLLRAAGYVLTESRLSDRIIITCIKNGINNVCEINGYLYEYGQPLLSA